MLYSHGHSERQVNEICFLDVFDTHVIFVSLTSFLVWKERVKIKVM